jgi:GxxExxY protein
LRRRVKYVSMILAKEGIMLQENEIVTTILDAAFEIHRNLGPGLFESVYETILAHSIEKRGLAVERQKPIPFTYDGLAFDEGFRADIIVEDTIILELKSVESVSAVHKKQLLTYLRLADKRLGLLINFGAAFLKNGIYRIANNLDEKG